MDWRLVSAIAAAALMPGSAAAPTVPRVAASGESPESDEEDAARAELRRLIEARRAENAERAEKRRQAAAAANVAPPAAAAAAAGPPPPAQRSRRAVTFGRSARAQTVAGPRGPATNTQPMRSQSQGRQARTPPLGTLPSALRVRSQSPQVVATRVPPAQQGGLPTSAAPVQPPPRVAIVAPPPARLRRLGSAVAAPFRESNYERFCIPPSWATLAAGKLGRKIAADTEIRALLEERQFLYDRATALGNAFRAADGR